MSETIHAIWWTLEELVSQGDGDNDTCVMKGFDFKQRSSLH